MVWSRRIAILIKNAIRKWQMKVSFLLPTPGDNPVGGYKVVYEYAGGLVALGHRVTVLHRMIEVPGASRLRQHARYLKFLAKGDWKPTRWFSVDPRVNLNLVTEFTPRAIGSSDAVVATAWSTAEQLAKLPSSCGRKCYFVQDYEHYMSANADVRNRIASTFRLGFHTIGISPACRQLVEMCGGIVHTEVPNGLDHNRYKMTEPICSNERNGIGFPYRSEPFKRASDAIEVFRRVRATMPGADLRYWTFGAKRPIDLPNWIEFYEQPTDGELVALYNRSAVFLVPSEFEGWGLPGSEAMCCGAALVSTNNGGVLAYATHGRNALISPPLDVDSLAANISTLMCDSSLRVTLVETALSDIGQFTWQRSTKTLEQSLTELPKRHA
jgi:glycosyltransferase involved in cell wall biosynthesis